MARTQTRQVVIRMTESDYQKMKKRVVSSGMSQVEFLTGCILKTQIINTDGMKSLLPEMKRIGVNLNQIAKILNQGGGISYNLIYEIRKEWEYAWQSLKRFLPKLQ